MPGPRLCGQGSSLATLVSTCPLGRRRPASLPLTALGPGKKKNRKEEGKKENFPCSSWPQKEKKRRSERGQGWLLSHPWGLALTV